MLVIKSKNFMTSSHLIYENGGFKWSSKVPENAIVSDLGVRSLEEIGKIFGQKIRRP